MSYEQHTLSFRPRDGFEIAIVNLFFRTDGQIMTIIVPQSNQRAATVNKTSVMRITWPMAGEIICGQLLQGRSTLRLMIPLGGSTEPLLQLFGCKIKIKKGGILIAGEEGFSLRRKTVTVWLLTGSAYAVGALGSVLGWLSSPATTLFKYSRSLPPRCFSTGFPGLPMGGRRSQAGTFCHRSQTSGFGHRVRCGEGRQRVVSRPTP